MNFNLKSRSLRRTVIAIIGLSLIILLWQTAYWTRLSALENLEENSSHQLSLYVSNLQGQLEKYKFLPEMLSTNDQLKRMLENPTDLDRIVALNRYLETINKVADASDTYLMDANGLTIAASNWNSERPFVGRNFAYRPYFQQAMKGELGRYYALGSTSNKRGYYFAYPVRAGKRILGAVVMKTELAPLEKSWSYFKEEFMVTDPDGVIFIATDKEWRFKTLRPLKQEVRKRILESRRYLDAQVVPLGVDFGDQIGVEGTTVKMYTPKRVTYLMQEQQMPEAGWTVHILTDLRSVSVQVGRSLILAAFLFGALVLLVMAMVQRQIRLHDRARYERRAKHLLEIRVKERTQDLTQTNLLLTHEIDERRRTEERLRQTQDELIQAAKMAALGQMSTGISHELNQPLAAIRSYADNARALLQRDRADDASWNMEQISELTDRMAKISSQLKVFARKTTGQIVSVSLQSVVDNSLKILAPRIKEAQTEIALRLPKDELLVLADMVQLEQVVVNLVDNALHAVESQDQRFVEITSSIEHESCRVTIRDNGMGIDEKNLPRVFDPFFTTKDEERGLGLGLSISFRIIEGMNGTLEAANHPSGGAVFTLQLPMAVMPAVVQVAN